MGTIYDVGFPQTNPLLTHLEHSQTGPNLLTALEAFMNNYDANNRDKINILLCTSYSYTLRLQS